MNPIVLNVQSEIQVFESFPLEVPHVPIFDRGFLYGDSLYEVVRTYDGRFLFLKEHLERLARSAHLCHLPLSQSLEQYEREMNRSLETFQNALKTRGLPPSEAYCRLVVTRGSGRIGFSRSAVQTPTFWCTITQKVATPGPEDFERGLKLALVERERNSPRALTPEAKSGNYLNSVLAFLEAENFHAADDAIFCDSEGFLTEGTTFNLFYVRRGKVATPPVEVGILRGITRNHVLRLAKKEGLDTREVRFTPEHLLEADEVFVTSSIREVLPVSRVYLPKMFQTVSLREGWHPIQKGRPGPVTRRLARLFREAIPEWLGEN